MCVSALCSCGYCAHSPNVCVYEWLMSQTPWFQGHFCSRQYKNVSMGAGTFKIKFQSLCTGRTCWAVANTQRRCETSESHVDLPFFSTVPHQANKSSFRNNRKHRHERGTAPRSDALKYMTHLERTTRTRNCLVRGEELSCGSARTKQDPTTEQEQQKQQSAVLTRGS